MNTIAKDVFKEQHWTPLDHWQSFGNRDTYIIKRGIVCFRCFEVCTESAIVESVEAINEELKKMKSNNVVCPHCRSKRLDVYPIVLYTLPDHLPVAVLFPGKEFLKLAYGLRWSINEL